MLLERTLKIASVEKREDGYGIWPEMATPFSLPCHIFGDRKPQREDTIMIEYQGDDIVGAVLNEGRIMSPA